MEIRRSAVGVSFATRAQLWIRRAQLHSSATVTEWHTFHRCSVRTCCTNARMLKNRPTQLDGGSSGLFLDCRTLIGSRITTSAFAAKWQIFTALLFGLVYTNRRDLLVSALKHHSMEAFVDHREHQRRRRRRRRRRQRPQEVVCTFMDFRKRLNSLCQVDARLQCMYKHEFILRPQGLIWRLKLSADLRLRCESWCYWRRWRLRWHFKVLMAESCSLILF